MPVNLIRTESIVNSVLKKIEHINTRIKSIGKSYEQINSQSLKIRLLNEHKFLKHKFMEIKPIVLLLENSSSNNCGYSRILSEKFRRCEKEILKSKALFST